MTNEVVDGIPIIRVTTFNSEQHDKLMELGEIARRVRDESVVIVDLRNNGGGSDTYAQEFFRYLTKGTLQYAMMEELLSAATHQGTINWATCSLARPNLDGGARTLFKSRRDRALARLKATPPGGRTWDVKSADIQAIAPKVFAGSLVVIINHGCGSACEDFVMFARDLPNSVLVGENTAGASAFGDVRRYRLPRSGIWMQAGIKWFHHPDPKQIAREGYGHLPNLWLDDEDPRSRALEVAKCLRSPACARQLRANIASASPPTAPPGGR